MNYKPVVFLSFLFILITASFVLANGGGHEGVNHDEDTEKHQESDWDILGLHNPLTIMGYGTIIAGLALIAGILFKNQMPEWLKHLTFILIAVPVILVTVYMVYATVLLNVESESGGPVHWHADFEIWACDEKIDLSDPKGLTNKVGSAVFHEHGDNRIHVEGVVLEEGQVTLGRFFSVIGGSFDGKTLSVPTNKGLKTWQNGYACDGGEGTWYVFVNGELIENPEDHIPAPYENIPPGDRIKLVFTEKPSFEINTEIGGAP